MHNAVAILLGLEKNTANNFSCMIKKSAKHSHTKTHTQPRSR